MTTKNQELYQAPGPHRPKAGVLASMLDAIPRHLQVEAISINGQTGKIVIETYHEGLEQQHEFSST